MKYQDYLPDTFRQTAEYTALGAAVDEPVAEWENEVAALPQEYFPTTAESRLGRWEKVLGLTSNHMQKSLFYRFWEDYPADLSFGHFLVFRETVITQENAVTRQQPEISVFFSAPGTAVNVRLKT